ncbi:MAG: alpha/beta hydrolase [Pseudomonadota bacterium]
MQQAVPERPTIVAIAGFGDNAGMFTPLLTTHLAQSYRLVPLDLPGFGAPKMRGITTLAALAEYVSDQAREQQADIVLAHSVASIIASLAAARKDSRITTILSIEGNLTPEDGYFSGLAADYPTPAVFREAFLEKLDAMARDELVIARYRDNVALADPDALWELGNDSRAFSAKHMPGNVLITSADIAYLYNPDNCPAASLAWLDKHPVRRHVLPGASHWPSVTQPDMLADAIKAALEPDRSPEKAG